MADNIPPVGSTEWWRYIAAQSGGPQGPPEGSPGFDQWMRNVRSMYGWRLGGQGGGYSGFAGGGPQYIPPHPSPSSTGQFEENLLANPSFNMRAQQNPLSLDAALLYSILGSREANAATEKDFKEAQGILYRNRDNARTLLRGAGETALQEEGRQYGKERAGLDQDLINRGLYSTSVKDALGNRLTEQSGRRREEIRRNTAGQQVNSDTLYAQLLSGLSGQRQRQFSPGIYQTLAGAANQPRGGNNFGSILGGLGHLAGSILPFFAA